MTKSSTIDKRIYNNIKSIFPFKRSLEKVIYNCSNEFDEMEQGGISFIGIKI